MTYRDSGRLIRAIGSMVGAVILLIGSGSVPARGDAAHDALDAFAHSTRPGVWPLVQKAQIITEIGLRLRDPFLVQQGNRGDAAQDFCGPAAIVFELVRHNPVHYVEVCQSLFENGAFHSLIGPDMITEVQTRLQPVPNSMAQVDWMLMAALWEQHQLFFSGPDDMQRWAKSLLGSDDVQYKNTFFTGNAAGQQENVLHQAADVVSHGGFAFLEIDWELITMDRLPGFPDHWVPLLGNVAIQNIGGTRWYNFDAYSWGGYYPIQADETHFKAGFWGAVIGSLPQSIDPGYGTIPDSPTDDTFGHVAEVRNTLGFSQNQNDKKAYEAEFPNTPVHDNSSEYAFEIVHNPEGTSHPLKVYEIEKDGAGAGDFSVSLSSADENQWFDGNIVFHVRFNPTVPGLRQATIHFKMHHTRPDQTGEDYIRDVPEFRLQGFGGPPTVPVIVNAVTLTPSTVTGGQRALGSVTLSAASPSGGAPVTLSTTNPAASVPSPVTVPEGATSATVMIATNPVPTSTSGGVTASYGGVSRSETLTVVPQETVVPVITNDSPVLHSGWFQLGFAEAIGGIFFSTFNLSESVDSTATWSGTLANGVRTYRVEVFIPRQLPSFNPPRTRSARYTISHAGVVGVTDVSISQQVGSSQWVDLGTFPFDGGYSVELTDRTGEASQSTSVVADAVRLTPVP